MFITSRTGHITSIARSGLLVAASTVLFALSAQAQPTAQPQAEAKAPAHPALSKPDAALPWDSEVRRGALPNKMRYFIEANQHPAGRAELRLVVNAGSVLEDDDQLGLAHFVEHMAFNGSEHFKGNELVSTLESFGMKFGAHLNAYTSFDETVYQLQIPTEPEKLKVALQILRDWAGGVSFDPEEIEKERGVVLDEWRRSLGAGQRIQDRLIPFQFNHSRYAERLPIGTEASLKGFKPEQLTRFYRDWYRPDLMTLIVVGDVDVDAIEAQIKAQFGDLKNPETPRARPSVSIDTYTSQISEVFIDPELPSIALQLSELHPHREPTTRAGYRADYIGDIAIRILSSRLGELRKQATPPFMYAVAYQSPLTASMEARGLMLVPFEGKLPEAINATIAELKRIQKHGVTQSELDRAQRVTLSYLDQLIKEERTEKSEGAAAELVRHATTGEPVPGLKAEAALLHEIAPTVSVEELNARLRSMLSGPGWCATLMGPTQSAAWLPDGPKLGEMIREAMQKEAPDAYQDLTTDAPLVPNPPKGGSVTRAQSDEVTGATIWELSNGIKVILKPTDFEDNTVLMHGFRWGGTSTVSDQDYVPAAQAASLAASSGLGSWTSTTLPKRLAGVQASASLEISELEIGLSGTSTLRDLDVMFELMWLRATASQIDEEVFNTALRSQREGLKRRDLDPSTEYYDTYQRLMWGDHPRRQPPSQSEIDRADLKRSRELLKSLTADWSGSTFIFVGKLDLKTFKPKVARWIGGLPSSVNLVDPSPQVDGQVTEIPSFKDIGAQLTRGQHVKVIKRGLEPKAQVILSINGDFKNNPTNRYELRSLNQLLSMRLREVLREREGGTYSVGAQGNVIERPIPEYSITVSFGCDPKRVDELVKLTWDEIKRLKSAPPTGDEVKKISAMQGRTHEVNVKRNDYWLGALGSNATRDEPSSALRLYWSLHEKLTASQLHEAAKRYLKDTPSVQVTLLPQEAPAANEEPVKEKSTEHPIEKSAEKSAKKSAEKPAHK